MRQTSAGLVVKPRFFTMKIKDLKISICISLMILMCIYQNIFAEDSPADVLPADVVEYFLEHEGRPIEWSDIGGSQGNWARLKNYVKNVTGYDLPEYSDIQHFQESLIMSAVGGYVNVSSGTLSSIVADLLDSPDFWDLVTFDTDDNMFYFGEGSSEFIKTAVDSYIYDTPASSDFVTGLWREIPYQPQGWGSYYQFKPLSSNSSVVYITVTSNGHWIFASFVTGQGVNWAANSFNPNYYCTNLYQGSVSAGYYGGMDWYVSSDIGNWDGGYADINTALGDLFGTWDTGEPVLNGNGIIVNENFTPSPVNIPAALYYPYGTTINNNYINNIDESYPMVVNRTYPYKKTYVDLHWDEPEPLPSYEFPDWDIDDITFENIEIDENIDAEIETLNDSWLVGFLAVAGTFIIVGLII